MSGWSVALAACFSPSPPTGVPCLADTDCPGAQLCHPITRTCETSCTNCTPDGPEPPDADGAAVTCWDRWLSGTVALTQPRELDNLTVQGTNTSNPSISDDGLVLYFDRGQDFFRATRDNLDAELDSALLIQELRTDQNESRISTTADDQLAVFASARAGTQGLLDLWQARRADDGTFEMPSADLFGSINDANNQFDPEITADGLHLYWAPSIEGKQLIHHASRASLDAPFTGTSTLAIPHPTLTDVFDPSISPDHRVLAFAGTVGMANSNLYFTTRAGIGQPFALAVEIPGINTDEHEGDSELSADGCTLYFVSSRLGGNRIFAADVLR